MKKRIGLIDVDGHHFPNFALMKIANFHRQQGDTVEWVDYLKHYDKVYQSKVFTFTPDIQTPVQADEGLKGETGYKMYDELFCEDMEPDYSLYPQYPAAYGFLTRGCIRRCRWCIVPEKEGGIRPYRDIETVLQGRKTAVLMDNNVLTSNHGLRQLEKIIDLKCKVDFNQGLDSRLVTEEVAKMLSKIKWLRYIRFACDTASAIEPLLSATEKLNRYGVKNYWIFVYVLVREIEDANMRCRMLKRLGITPFAQPYRDFNTSTEPALQQKRFARYVNHKAIFNSIDWEDYRG
ncbi:hypothetical protein EZS27_029739 [termite gut metagenome]|uniref:Radical SAM core domain-containing protein n=1 Tax=termite gut metagenome TaxID=433724 RepID=A0A5J4QFD8_9ZZZZ